MLVCIWLYSGLVAQLVFFSFLCSFNFLFSGISLSLASLQHSVSLFFSEYFHLFFSVRCCFCYLITCVLRSRCYNIVVSTTSLIVSSFNSSYILNFFVFLFFLVCPYIVLSVFLSHLSILLSSFLIIAYVLLLAFVYTAFSIKILTLLLLLGCFLIYLCIFAFLCLV